MINLLEYEDWSQHQSTTPKRVDGEYCRWKGVVCRILGEEGNELLLDTPTGKRRVNRDEVQTIEDEETLTIFKQISAPTIAY